MPRDRLVAAAVAPTARTALEVGVLFVEGTVAHRALRVDPEADAAIGTL